MTEDDAVSALRILPGDGPVFVANQVAGSALETLLVVEQNSPVVRGHEQLRRTGHDARLRGAATTHLTINDDVCSMRHPKVDGVHTIVETKWGTARHPTTLDPLPTLPHYTRPLREGMSRRRSVSEVIHQFKASNDAELHVDPAEEIVHRSNRDTQVGCNGAARGATSGESANLKFAAGE